MIQVTKKESGEALWINPDQIITMHAGQGCTVINMRHCRYLEVRETCEEIVKLIADWETPIDIIRNIRAYYGINDSLVKVGELE